MSWPQVLTWRLARQFISRPAALPPAAVAARLVGIQAQVQSAAVLSVRLRQQISSPSEVAAALVADGTLLRTWAMRGTLHLLATADAPDQLALMAALRTWERPAWIRYFGTSPSDIDTLAAAVTDLLRDGRCVTREELIDQVIAVTGSEHLAEHLRSGWGSMLKPLAYQGLLCQGPMRGNRATFMAPSARFPDWPGLPPVAEAASRVIRRFLAAHGPASPERFAAWLGGGLGARLVRGWFAAMGEELAPVEVDGRQMLLPRELLDELLSTEVEDGVQLLGGFDHYLLGAGTDCVAVVPAGHRGKVSRTAGWISPVVLRQGRVVGTWAGPPVATSLWESAPRRLLDPAVARMQALLARVPFGFIETG